MFATILGPYPRPAGLDDEAALDLALADQLDANLGMLADGRPAPDAGPPAAGGGAAAAGGRTPLAAAEAGNLVLRSLLAAGAPVVQVEEDGLTAVGANDEAERRLAAEAPRPPPA